MASQLTPANCVVGSFLGGTLFCGRYASGQIIDSFPGFGFRIDNEGYEYLIINNFDNSTRMSRNFLEYFHTDYTSMTVADSTILFWLNGGHHAKSVIYGVELRHKSLIHPFSDIGLKLRLKIPNPISPDTFYTGIENSEEWNFIKHTGIRPNGHCALDVTLKQETEWHLRRSKILSTKDALPYNYVVLSGDRLLIELNGTQYAIVRYNDNDVSSYSYAPDAFPLTTAAPHANTVPNEILWGGENRFIDSVKRLTDSQIDDGIEKAHWAMKKIRLDNLGVRPETSDEFINAQMWLDAAYDEKQYRREAFA